jgi:predicted RND superfamily exporter protein
VRLRPGLSPRARADALASIRRAVAMPDWRLSSGPGAYVVTGAPVVVDELTDAISASIAVLLAAALVVMALTLLLVFRARRRLLPLLVAVAATAITFGLLWASGRPLTMASVAVLPILIGLGVDYAVQLQARMGEEAARGLGVRAAAGGWRGRGRRRCWPRRARARRGSSSSCSRPSRWCGASGSCSSWGWGSRSRAR